ncbi:hypothetical protein [Heyndrickxia oleronia]|uniref:hypothetical protein n=1 Tax=Heyndrickxia oleronia TaxID=38875 RepID=UPI001C0ECA67|nr:hypothetical protein [Heyndrickxia oleronia]MBU5214484.1 hypothetical protein [Heyndrickxia oleronia]
MEKTVTIDGKEIKFKSTGATPIRFKSQFGKDYFTEIMKLGVLDKLNKIQDDDFSADDLEGLDFEVFYNIAWTFAKTANNEIPDPLDWLDSFDEFPILDIASDLMEMIMKTIQSKKK